MKKNRQIHKEYEIPLILFIRVSCAKNIKEKWFGSFIVFRHETLGNEEVYIWLSLRCLAV